MVLEVKGEATWWKGPAPYVFLPIVGEQAVAIKAISNRVSYGWGCIQCSVRLGGSDYTTALFPKEGNYMIPIKVKIQRAERIEVGDPVSLTLTIPESEVLADDDDFPTEPVWDDRL